MDNPKKKVTYDLALRLSPGVFVHSYHELVSELENLSETHFKKLVGPGHDQIAGWIKEHYADDALQTELLGVASKPRYLSTLKMYAKRSKNTHSRGSSLVPVLFLTVLLLTVIFVQQCAVAKYTDVNELRMGEAQRHLLDQQIRIATLENTIEALEDENKELVLMNNMMTEAAEKPTDVLAPPDRIPGSHIRPTNEGVFIVAGYPSLSIFTDSGSMLPVFGSGHTGIKLRPGSPAEIRVGDIISYEEGEGIIAHRVVRVGSDEEGWYAIAKGDNNLKEDESKVRFNQISGVLVAVIY